MAEPRQYKGSQIKQIRFPDELLDQVTDYLKTPKGKRWDFSSFVRAAVEEKLQHLQRSRKGSKFAQAGDSASGPASIQSV